jgi:cAMP phosphodiesterase
VLLTHAHLDHVLALPLLADSVIRHRQELGRPPICVHALDETIQALRRHLFNDALWPDFTRLPHEASPVLRLQPVEVGQQLRIGRRLVEVLPARHAVPAVGYAVWDAESGDPAVWAFSGDTGPNPEIEPVLRRLKPRHWVIEVAFSDQDQALAQLSGHLCPATLVDEIRRVPPQARVHLTHIKPGEAQAIESDLARLGVAGRWGLLQAGDEFTI